MGAKIAEEVLTVGAVEELTAANANLFRKMVCTALDRHTVVEIDLSQTTFMDAAGLGALVAVHILTRRRNGVVRLVNPTPPVQQVLDLVRAGQIFEIVHTARQTIPSLYGRQTSPVRGLAMPQQGFVPEGRLRVARRFNAGEPAHPSHKSRRDG